jgi:hypothetical protein
MTPPNPFLTGRNAPRTWEMNADDFALLDRGEGFPFAVLIACSVERNAANGRPRTSAAAGVSATKVSMNAFAQRARTDGNRVRRYLDAWEKAAEDGLVPHAADLSPEDALTVRLPNANWSDYYDASTAVVGGHRAPSDAVRAIEKHGAAAVYAALPPQQQRELARAAVDAAPVQDLQAIRARADEKIAEAMPEVNAFNAQARAARDAETARSGSFWRYSNVGGHIASARDRLRDALKIVQLNGTFTDVERADLVQAIDRLDAASGLLRLALAGTADIDWDAALLRMGEH